ncbi:uncharacterized protein LOC124361500 [Homalodisca vitripennis]|uniref:uncharacterized protein LOC124361500 n=1 Tax=Homalodisca vitripennis TaxID=197043 RepID=UPI001EEA414C|nr:uncharacterized protein LOC124361500 [Homalodisca vitripennis]XP_046671512.1 uncharacterized protein LOC124361500 [Homalodisca vitripennis]KAG8293851.1 hypothetical protein J6590_007516 [Homalodisca vitripennis]
METKPSLVGQLSVSDLRALIDEKLENITTKTSSKIQTQITDLQEDNVTLKQEIDSLKKKVLSLDCYSRRNNVIFKGLKLTSEDNYKEAVVNFCCEMFDMSNKLWVNRAYPITKNKSLILAQFPDDKDVHEILSKRFQLKGTEYAVFQDLPEEVRYKRARLFAVRAEVERILAMRRMIICFDHLNIDECRFTWENEKLVSEGMDGCEKLNRLFNHDFGEFLTKLAENGPPYLHRPEPVIQPTAAVPTPVKSNFDVGVLGVSLIKGSQDNVQRRIN